MKKGNLKSFVSGERSRALWALLFFDGKGISNTQFKTYNNIVEMLVGRQSQENIERSENETKLQVFPYATHIRVQLMDIAKVAFDQLFPIKGHSAVVFDSKSCNLNTASKTFALKCGLLTEKKSKSFSSRSSHLSFTHKSVQEFFSAIYLGEHEKLFETVIERRYRPCDGEFETCMNDLSQIFVFMAGINGKIAHRLSILMNSHLVTMPLKVYLSFSPSDKLTRLVASGLQEADNNGLRDIKLCMHFMGLKVKTNDGLDMYQRLISMNKTQLVYLSVQIDFNYEDGDDDHQLKLITFLKQVVSVQNCTQLRHLSLIQMDLGKDLLYLGAHELVLPANITDINLKQIAMTGGLSVQHCSQLQHLKLDTVDLGEHKLVLPDNIIDIKLWKVAMTGHLSVQHCSQLQHLTIQQINLGEHRLVLPDSITHIKLMLVTITGGLSVHTCSQLLHLDLDRVDIGEHKLALPDNITYIKMYNLAMTGGLSVQHCTQLQHLELHTVDLTEGLSVQHCTQLQHLQLAYLDLGEHKLMLPNNIIHLDLFKVTMNRGLSVQHCRQLERLTLDYLDLGEHELALPDNLTHIILRKVTMVGGLLVQHCSQLQDFTLGWMDFDDDFPRLPNSITKIVLKCVTLPVRTLLALLEHLENLPRALKCEIRDCTVEPSSEHGQVKNRLDTSTNLQFNGYNIETEGWEYETMCFKCWK